MHYRQASLLSALLTLLVAVGPLAAQAPDLGPGTHQQSFTHGGRDRTYVLHVPRGYDGRTPTPLVFLFHGGGGSPAGIESRVGFRTLADEGGFIGVVPNGISGFWNDGGPDSLMVPQIGNVDDVGFVAALIDHLAGRFRIDPLRIYATGFSNGAFLSNRLGMELSARFAAVAPVSGTLGTVVAPNFAPQNPVAVLYVHGTSDGIVPYGGGQVAIGGVAISAAELVNLWVKANGCATPARTEQLPRVRRDTYAPCRAGTEVVFYTIESGGHDWPVNANINTTQLIWEFFRQHPKAR